MTFDDIRVSELGAPERCHWCSADGIFHVHRRSLLNGNTYGDAACRKCSLPWIRAMLRAGLADALRQRSLTPAEIRLAIALFEGRSVQSYAKQAGISINTARWHVKNIYNKAHVNRQTQLFHSVLRDIGLIGRET